MDKMIHTTPKEITERILRFCREKIDSTTKPLFLKLTPVGNCRLKDCFGNVEDYVKNDGDCIQYGWIIWETPDYFVEGEFHAVWINKDGEYFQIAEEKMKAV